MSRLTRAESGRYENVVEFEYDGAGRLAAESLTLDGVLIDALVELTTEYIYDEAGRLVKLVYPGGEEALRVYSGRGELEEVKLRFSPTHAWGFCRENGADWHVRHVQCGGACGSASAQVVPRHLQGAFTLAEVPW